MELAMGVKSIARSKLTLYIFATRICYPIVVFWSLAKVDAEGSSPFTRSSLYSSGFYGKRYLKQSKMGRKLGSCPSISEMFMTSFLQADVTQPGIR